MGYNCIRDACHGIITQSEEYFAIVIQFDTPLLRRGFKIEHLNAAKDKR